MASDTAEPRAARERPMRADARRNRDRLLAAARPAFAKDGPEASLDDIARRAGVGPGTLYRHFPTRESLMEALYRADIGALSAHAHQLRDTLPAEQALAEFMRAAIASTVATQGMKAALSAVMDGDSELFAWCRTTLLDAVESLLAKARADGAVRADLSASDLMRLCHGLAGVLDYAPGAADRLISFAFDGIRAQGDARPAVGQG